MINFNRTWAKVTRALRGRNEIGWDFECNCGAHKLYKNEFFPDAYESAMAALRKHQCKVA